MIKGSLTEELNLLVPVEIVDHNGTLQRLEVVLDTGFSGDLALPSNVIRTLGLTYRGQGSWTLADGQRVTLSDYDGVVSWHEQRREVRVLETEGESLLGLSLLLGSKLTVNARVGGDVLIEPLTAN